LRLHGYSDTDARQQQDHQGKGLAHRVYPSVVGGARYRSNSAFILSLGENYRQVTGGTKPCNSWDGVIGRVEAAQLL
jgi:hypothetical protein